MTITRTLGDIIATRDYTGLTVNDRDWSLSADAIENLLYDHDYAAWELGSTHLDAFLAKDRVKNVEINTWWCSDQTVGLELIILDETPVILKWQTGRKSELQMAFVDAAAREFLAREWEACRPATEAAPAKILSDDMLAMPVSDDGTKPYSIDRSSAVDALRLSAHGVWQWLEHVNANGGLAQVRDKAALHHCLEAARAELAHDRERVEDFTSQYADRPDLDLTPLAEYQAEVKDRCNRLIEFLIEPLVARIDALEIELQQG